ncbi:MAG: acyl carrier protein [Elusimicrobia bacterium]|nr:acyl carrier protein [Elusimicrobiota bacterium]
MATSEEIRGSVLKYVKDEYVEDEDQEVGCETPLISGGIVDSFSMVSLKRFLENKYKIQIPDDKTTPEAFDNVNRITALVESLIGQAPGLNRRSGPPAKPGA